MSKTEVIVESKSCEGTGIFVGWLQRKGEGDECTNCGGYGWKKLSYEEVNPTEYPKEREGVDKVSYYTLEDGKRVEHCITYDGWKQINTGE